MAGALDPRFLETIDSINSAPEYQGADSSSALPADIAATVASATKGGPPQPDDPTGSLPPDIAATVKSLTAPAPSATPPETSSALGAFGRHVAPSILPTAAGMAGAGAGAELGGAAGAVVGGPIGATVGALGGGLTGFIAPAWVTGKAQQAIFDRFPALAKLVGQAPEQRTADEEQHPYASLAGDIGPQLMFLRPGAIAKAPAAANALERLLAHPVAQRGFGAGLGALQDLTTQEMSGQPIDLTDIGISAGMGALLNRETALGRMLAGGGARAARTVLPKIPVPTAPPAAPPNDRAIINPEGSTAPLPNQPATINPEGASAPFPTPAAPDWVPLHDKESGEHIGWFNEKTADIRSLDNPPEDVARETADKSVKQSAQNQPAAAPVTANNVQPVQGFATESSGRVLPAVPERGATGVAPDTGAQPQAGAQGAKEPGPAVAQPVGAAGAASAANVNAEPVVPAPVAEPGVQAQDIGDGTRLNPVKVATPEGVTKAGGIVNTEPTDAQKAAGNYQKGHIKLHGMDITIENPKGSIRSGIGPDGKRWEAVMPADYGYIKGTKDNTGEHVDVTVGPNPQSKSAFIIHQKDLETGEYDEPKSFLAFNDPKQVRDAYVGSFSDGRGAERIDSMERTSVEAFRKRAEAGEFTKAPKLTGPRSALTIPDEHAADVTRLEIEAMQAAGKKRGGPSVAANGGGKAATIEPTSQDKTPTLSGRVPDNALAPSAQAGEELPKQPVVPQITKTATPEPGDKPAITADQARIAMNTNIDPRTGKRPKGNKALRDMRSTMKLIIRNEKGALEKRSNRGALGGGASDKERPFLNAVWAEGGIRTRNAAGDLTKEGQEVAHILRDHRMPGLINNRAGMSPDAMRSLFQQHGWFRGTPDQGDDLTTFYDYLDRSVNGNKVHHPESEAFKNVNSQAAEQDREQAIAKVHRIAEDNGAKLNEADVKAIMDRMAGGQNAEDAVGDHLERQAIEAESNEEETGRADVTAGEGESDLPFGEKTPKPEPETGQEKGTGTPPQGDAEPSEAASGKPADEVKPAAGKSFEEYITLQKKHRDDLHKAVTDTFERDKRVVGVSREVPDYKIVLTKGTESPYRVTSFKQGEPIGHREYKHISGSGHFLDDAASEFNSFDIEPAKKPPKAEAPKVELPESIKEYIGAIRNEAKKDYAQRYAEWMVAGEKGENPGRGDLSVMGAQAARMEIREKVEAATKAPAETATDKQPLTFESFAQLEAKMRQGDMTAAEAMDAFERVLASEKELKAELLSYPKDRLAKMNPRDKNETKAKIVDGLYSSFKNSFNASGTYSWSPFGKEGPEAGIRKVMEKQTDADIKAAAEKRKQHRAEMVQTYTNPQTLSQFRDFIHARGEDKLTPEQKVRYDELVSEDNRAQGKREAERSNVVKKAETEGAEASEIIETKHTQKGHDLFVVKMNKRVGNEAFRSMLTNAKRLGGSYSSWAKDGAVPGFQFKTREAAERFKESLAGDVSKTDLVEKRAEEVKGNAVERLRDMAAKMTESADEDMSRERKTNTARRADQAAGAEAKAAANKALATTMRNLADAIEEGDVKHLEGIRTRADVETLDRLLRRAKNEWAREQQRRDPTQRYEKLMETPTSREMVAHASFPWPYADADTAIKLAEHVKDRPGLKRMAAALIKEANYVKRGGGWKVDGYNTGIQEMLSVIAKAVEKDPRFDYEGERILETFEDYKRLGRMELKGEEMLRAALREFLDYRGKTAKADPLKAAERALIGTKIEGYFPTPKALVERMVEEAQIKPGMDVLEPSAGKGNIADGIRDAEPEAKLSLIEPVSSLRNILEMKGHNVIGRDFMEQENLEGGTFDRIVMNPPFENGQDIDHVKHAYDLLKPGGRIVAIMSEGPFYRSDRKASEFRDWLNGRGHSEKNPEKSFADAERPTGVATRLVVIDKPAEYRERANAPKMYERDEGQDAAYPLVQRLNDASHAKEVPGDVRLLNDKFVSFDDAVATAKEAVDSEVMKPWPAQLGLVLQIAPRDWDRVIAAVKKAPEAKPSAAYQEFAAAQKAYRAREIDDAAFLAAKKKYDEATREFATEPGAEDAQGNALPQTIVPGAEGDEGASAKRAAGERAKAEMLAKAQQSKMRRGGQAGVDEQEGGLFDKGPKQQGMFAKRVEPTKETVDAFEEQTKEKYGLQGLRLHYRPNEKTLVLDHLVVPKENRRQGVGTNVMREIAQYADQHGLRTVLSPGVKDDHHGTTSRSRLVDFYKRFGFVENKGRNKDYRISEGMYREARTEKTDTPEFKRWFGKSKVVDEAGQPLEVYHGTPVRGIQQFDTKPYDLRWGDKDINFKPFYFTDNRGVAESYGDHVMSVYLSFQKPRVLNARGKTWNDFSPFGEIGETVARGEHDSLIIKNIRDEHDGEGDLSTVYVALKPEQIKSATRNRGTFDPTDARINFAKRDGEPAKREFEEIGKGVYAAYSKDLLEKRAALAKTLRSRLDALGLHDVGLRIADALYAREGADGKPQALDGYQLHKIISVALDAEGHGFVLDHEAIHALRALNLFTEKEWKTLTEAATRVLPGETKSWFDRYDIARRYGEQSREIQLEEAVAHAFMDWRAGKDTRTKLPLARRIYARVRNALSALASAFRGHGFNTVDSVFGKTARGEVGSRERSDPTGQGRFHAAFHGTPHDFDEFSTEHIGKGEGAQAYGWGLYFAGNRKVAEYYREKLAGKGRRTWGFELPEKKRLAIIREALRDKISKTGQVIKEAKNEFLAMPDDKIDEMFRNAAKAKSDWAAPTAVHQYLYGEFGRSDMLNTLLNEGGYRTYMPHDDNISHSFLDTALTWLRRDGTPEQARAIIQRNTDNIPKLEKRIAEGDADHSTAMLLDEYKRARDYLEKNPDLEPVPPHDPGRLFQVDLKPKEDEYLDWDKPMGEQSEAVRKALSDAGLYRDKPNPPDWEGDEANGKWEYVDNNGGYGRGSVLGWAVPNPRVGGYDVHHIAGPMDNADRGYRGYRGHAPTLEKAKAWIEKDVGNMWKERDVQLPAATYYHNLANKEGGAYHASMKLRDAGVPGIRYADQMSRHRDDEPTHNYVVFDDKHITVEGKYALRRPAAGIVGLNLGEASPSTVEYLHDKNLGFVERLKGATSRAALGEASDRLRTALQDRFLPLLRVQQKVQTALGRQLTEEERPYQKQERQSGRVGSKLEDLTNKATDLIHAMAAKKISVAELEAFLYARHAPERNAEIASRNEKFRGDLLGPPGAGSGMTNEAAQAIMDATGAKRADYDALAGMVDSILKDSINERVAAGLLSPEQADKWRATWKHYVPLRGKAELDPETASLVRPRSGGAFNVRGKESQMAFGRETPARDILPYVLLQAEEAIARGESNRVARAFHDLAKAAPDPKFWKVNKVETRPVWNKAKQQVEYEPVVKMLAEDADYTITTKIDGKEQRVTLNKENAVARRLAESMKGIPDHQVSAIVATFGAVNRVLSHVNTTLNPEFVITNAFRDMTEAMANLRQYDTKGLIAGTIKDYPKALRGAMRGAFGKEDGTWGKYYNEFRSEGGRVYFNRLEDIGDLRHKLETELRMANSGPSVRKALHSVGSFIEKVNMGVENGIRLSAYKNAREVGMSKGEAASLAKNLTVNFNRRGSYGPLMNSLYLFYNASVQGSATLIGAAARSAKVRQVLAGAIGLGAAMEMLNAQISDTDKDGTLYYDGKAVTAYDKSRNLIIMDPTDGKRAFKIPLPYGYSAFYGIGRALGEAYRGKKATDIAGNLATTILDAFNPIGGSENIVRLLSPTITDPIVDLYSNTDYSGRPIAPNQPDFGGKEPNTQRYWNNVSPIAKTVTDFLGSATGGNQVEPGLVDLSPEWLDYLFGQVTGAAGTFYERNADLAAKLFDPNSEITWNDIPFARRVVASKAPWVDRGLFYSRVEETEQAMHDVKTYAQRGEGDSARAFVERNKALVSLDPLATKTRAGLSKVRNILGALALEKERGKISADDYNAKVKQLRDTEDSLITQFNKVYNDRVLRPEFRNASPVQKPGQGDQANNNGAADNQPNGKLVGSGQGAAPSTGGAPVPSGQLASAVKAADAGALQSLVDNGLTWTRQDAVKAATASGYTATAALLRQAADPLRKELQDRLMMA